MNEDNFARYRDLAYAAALDQSAWVTLIGLLADHIGAIGATFIVLDTQAKAPRAMDMIGQCASVRGEYEAFWWQYDPQVGAACALTRSSVYTNRDHPQLAEERARAYQDWERRSSIGQHISSISLVDNGNLRGGLSFHAPHENDFLSTSNIELLNALMSHIGNAMALGFAHNQMLDDAFWNGIIVGKSDPVAFLLDECGRVIRHTERAGELISKRDGLDITGRKLRAILPSEHASLNAIIGRAIEIGAPQSGAMRVSRISGKLSLIVVCYPLVRKRRALAPFEAAALLTVVDPSARPRSAANLLREAFNLTARETEFADALAMGHSVESAAATLGCSMPTARTHLRRLFEKTGTSGQGSLIRRLAQLP